jgi:5'-nucleotidase / UDP-sugar diphosphatase
MRFILLAASLIALATALPARAQHTVTILHINDVHSRIEAINKYDSTCSAEEAANDECFGGMARVAAKIAERRQAIAAAGGEVLVLDAGDQFQGSLFYTTYKGSDAVEFMNMIGFDAMAVGNHEFDDGPDNLARFIDAAKFPVISGNTKVAAVEASLAGRIAERVVLERGGKRIAILSVLATDTDATSSPGANVSFADEIAYLREAVAAATAEGIDRIVLLSHVGLPRDMEIARAVDGIDIIVGGHSHTLMLNDDPDRPPYPLLVKNPSGHDVPIVQAYAYSKYLGEIAVTFDEAGRVVSAKGDPILLDATVKPDPAVEARVRELAAPLEELRARVVGDATAVIDGSRDACRFGECTMGRLVADALLDRVRGQGGEIAITNGGGLRASIDAGPVTMGEVMTVLPFQNTMATFRMSGRNILAALEHGVSGLEEGSGRFPQVAGLRFTFDPTQPPNGGRIGSVAVVGPAGEAPLDPERVYLVATNNFMRGGGDGYAMFVTDAEDAYDYGPNLEDVVAEYLARNNPYVPALDGRVTLAGGR